MEKKINKKKIKKNAGTLLLTGALTAGIVLYVADSNINHIEEICPIPKLEMALSLYPSHQENQMLKEYESQGMNVEANLIQVSYQEDYHDITTTTTITPATKVTLEDGTVIYVSSDGVLCGDMAIQKSIDIIPLEQLERRENAYGGYDIVVPEGYQFKLVGGVTQCVKVEEEGYPAFVTYKNSSNYIYSEEYDVLKLGR